MTYNRSKPASSARALKSLTEQGKIKMEKKYVCCVHDKKSDTFDAFSMFNNINEATRAFQATCEQNAVFKQWPEDFEFMLICSINYESGEINEKGEITKTGGFREIVPHYMVIAQAKDFIAIAKAKNEKHKK